MAQQLFNFQGTGAALPALAFLGTAGILVLLAVTAAVQSIRRRWGAARWVAFAMAAIAATYLAILGGVSLATRPATVEPGQAKYFCELDCHLAYSVASARRVPAIGAAKARGTFELVTVNVWFDPSTTSPRRGDAPLTPNPRAVSLIDARGVRYAPSAAGLAALHAAEGAQPPLSRPLRPGESYRTTLVFDLPADAPAAELLLTESDPVTRLLVGHENSRLHPPVPFRLPGSPVPAVRG